MCMYVYVIVWIHACEYASNTKYDKIIENEILIF